MFPQSSCNGGPYMTRRAHGSLFRALALLVPALAFFTVDIAAPCAAAAVPAARRKKKKRPRKSTRPRTGASPSTASPSGPATNNAEPAPSGAPPVSSGAITTPSANGSPLAKSERPAERSSPALRVANVASHPPEADVPSGAKPVGPPAPGGGQPIGFVSAFLATTIIYRPYRGSFEGPPGDISPTLGVGYNASKKIAFELDGGPTFVSGKYVSTSLIAGVVWTLHPIVYAAGRFLIPVHPELNFALFPGIGATYAFGSIAPFVEFNALSTVGRGEPDFGVVFSGGASYVF